jgi:hypothetical protein
MTKNTAPSRTTHVRIAGTCSLSVIGMDMNCPLCGTLVKSGESHSCSKGAPKKAVRSKAACESCGAARGKKHDFDCPEAQD